MLHAVSELSEYGFGDVGRGLRDEVDADALGTDEPDYLLDLVHKSLGSLVEEGVGLVEEEHELGQVHVSDFRQFGIDLRKQPEQEGGVELGVLHQLVGCQDAENALAVVGL